MALNVQHYYGTMTNGNTNYTQRGGAMDGNFVGFANGAPGAVSGMAGFGRVLGARGEQIRTDAVTSTLPGGTVGGASDFGPASSTFFNSLAAVNDTNVHNKPNMGVLAKFNTSASMFTNPSLPVQNIFPAANRPSVFTEKPIVWDADENMMFTHKAALNPDAYSESMFESPERMHQHFRRETYPLFAYTGSVRGMPLDKCCGDTFITWPEVNRIFEAAALCPEGPNEYKHDVFGYAFRNPTTFLDVFRFAGYPLGVQMTDGLREKTKVTLAIAHGAVESPNWWAGCSTKPTHGTHLYGQFVYCPIDAVTTKIGDKRIPLGLGDSFPTEKERQGEGAHTYRLVPRVEQVRAPRQRRRPIYGDRYLPSVHMAQVLTSNAVASRRHETAISGCLMPTPESAALTEAKMQNFPIIRIHVTLSSGRP